MSRAYVFTYTYVYSCGAVLRELPHAGIDAAQDLAVEVLRESARELSYIINSRSVVEFGRADSAHYAQDYS